MKQYQKVLLVLLTLGFVLWAGYYIYRSSIVVVDGNRYFCLFDDAMISMRYAYNLANGHGLVFNKGEYVEGFTNPLMVLIMSIPLLFLSKSMSCMMIQILGIAFILGIAYCVLLIGYRFFDIRGNYLLMLFLLFIAYYPLLYWSLLGMETGLYALLLCIAVYIVLDRGDEKKPLWSLVIVSVLLFLTRPDAVVPIAVILMYRYLTKPGLRVMCIEICVLLAFIIAKFIFSKIYFGAWLPNTYTLKIRSVPLFFRLKYGLLFVLPFLKETLIPILIGVIALVKARERKCMLLFSIFIAGLLYQVYVGGDPWNYWRLLAPFTILLFVLLFYALQTIPLRFNIKQWQTYLISLLALVAALCMMDYRFGSELIFKKRPLYYGLNMAGIHTAYVLNEVTTKDASIGVFVAGTLPYYCDRYVIDYLGKVDRHIASLKPDLTNPSVRSLPGHNKYDLGYSLLSLKPDFTSIFCWGTQDFTEWGKKNYIQVDYKGLSVWLKRDSKNILWEKINQ